MGLIEKIADIQQEIARTQKNKATEYHLGLLKAKLAKYRRELLEPPKSSGGGEVGFDVAKTGVARIGFVGFPSVGKSTLMASLTGTFSAVGAYEFTTLTAVPGVLQYMGAKIQILDLPGIIEGAKDGKGRGKQVIAVARTCSCIFIVLDSHRPAKQKQLIEHELEGFSIRLNKSPPNISIKKKAKGGIAMNTTVPLTYLNENNVRAILAEYRMHNADINFHCDATEDDLIDVIEGNRVYIPAVYVMNKIDQLSVNDLDIVYQIEHAVPISAQHRWNFDGLLRTMWTKLNLTRIYTKPRGNMPDFEAPVVLKTKGNQEKNTVQDFCNAIHKGLVKDFKHAMVWGQSCKFNPQKVGLNHELADEDVVQILKRV